MATDVTNDGTGGANAAVVSPEGDNSPWTTVLRGGRNLLSRMREATTSPMTTSPSSTPMTTDSMVLTPSSQRPINRATSSASMPPYEPKTVTPGDEATVVSHSSGLRYLGKDVSVEEVEQALTLIHPSKTQVTPAEPREREREFRRSKE